MHPVLKCLKQNNRASNVKSSPTNDSTRNFRLPLFLSYFLELEELRLLSKNCIDIRILQFIRGKGTKK